MAEIRNFMKILVILGSPRKNGNTETLVKTILDGACSAGLTGDIEYIFLEGFKNLHGCRSCSSCASTGECVIRDDMTELYGKMDAADILFLVTPVYFYGPSSQMKTFMDRFQARWYRKYILKQQPQNDKRFGFLISLGATKGEKLFDAIKMIVKNFFDTVHFPYSGEFFVRRKDEMGAFAADPHEIERARLFGRDIATRISEERKRCTG